MFRGLINDAKSAGGTVVAKYAVRASTAVPFVIALGFATAGITLMLVERFGHREAYVMIAAGFTAVGLLAVLVVRSKEIDRKQCQRMNEMAGRKPMSAEHRNCRKPRILSTRVAISNTPFALPQAHRQ